MPVYMQRLGQPKYKKLGKPQGIKRNNAFIKRYEDKAYRFGCDRRMSHSLVKLHEAFVRNKKNDTIALRTFEHYISYLRNFRDEQIPEGTRIQLYQFFNYNPAHHDGK
jgi:hypothetical protein